MRFNPAAIPRQPLLSRGESSLFVGQCLHFDGYFLPHLGARLVTGGYVEVSQLPRNLNGTLAAMKAYQLPAKSCRCRKRWRLSRHDEVTTSNNRPDLERFPRQSPPTNHPKQPNSETIATRADLERAERLLIEAHALGAAFPRGTTERKRSGKRRKRERGLLAAFTEAENAMRGHRDVIAELLRREGR
jgi:hypothetical protein